MRIKNLIWEDTVNYRKPSLFIGTARCSFKCGYQYCQNAKLNDQTDIEVDDRDVIEQYKSNPLTEAIVLGGLEPLDQIAELADFTAMLNVRKVTDDLVVYTGYTEEEAAERIGFLQILCKRYRDLVVKYGRYLPGRGSVFAPELGVTLASDNQYAVRYSAEKKKETH